jgi:dTMP kinase
MSRGWFIALEGGEGAGKSTQARLLKTTLEAEGRRVVLTREPGGSPFAEQVRELLMGRTTAPHSPLSEALLFYAARHDHLERVIRPALADGAVVVCDRFSDSTRVYQGAAGGLDSAKLETLDQIVVGATKPDLTLILDLPATDGLARASARLPRGAQGAPDSYEGRPLAFHERLRAGFLALAAAEPERYVVIDASAPADAVAAAVWSAVHARIFETLK